MGGRRWQDVLLVIAGLRLLISPAGMRGLAGEAFTLNVWILGAAVILAGIWALAAPRSKTPEWLSLIFGALTLFSPWLIRFATPMDVWNNWIIGAIIAALAIWSLDLMRGQPKGTSVKPS